MSVAALVSVVVCVRNGAATLRRQLDALAAQQDAPPFEVVIVDNGSTDATAAVAHAWIAEGGGAADDAYLVDACDRAGLGFARNVGAASSVGDVLAYCDADDIVGPRWVKGASSVRNGRWQAMTGPIFVLQSDGTPGAILMAEVDRVRGDAGIATRVPFFRGCNFALSRHAFEQVGGFDAGMPPYGADDTEIGIRLARAGIEIGVCAEMTVAYRRTNGWRSRLRRSYRSGIGQAVQWHRHPAIYPATPTALGLVGGIVSAPAARMTQRGATFKTRLLLAAEEFAFRVGAVGGTRGIRDGRYARVERYSSLRDRRPPRREAEPPHLAIITPVRHPVNSVDYREVEHTLRESVASWLGQTDPNVAVIVVANRVPVLPDDPRITVVTVDFAPPSPKRTARTGDAAVLRDKGTKNAIGLTVAAELGARHIMFADADDFISHSLAAYAHAHARQPGWTITDGWRVNLRRRTIRRHRGDFHLQCGTSHIIRADLFPSTGLDATASQRDLYAAYGDLLERWLGSHMFLHDDLPLRALPFPGALYQVGTRNSQSGNGLGGIGRPISTRIAKEFGVTATPLTPWGLARAVLPTGRAITERVRRVQRSVFRRLSQS